MPCPIPRDCPPQRRRSFRGFWLLFLGTSALLPAQRDPAPVGLAVTSEPNAPPLPNEPAVRLPIFFPPVPPVMGTPIRGYRSIDLRFVAPGALAPFVHERFYPALSTLYAEKRLTPRLTQRLADYLDQRRQAEGALLERLGQIIALAPEARPPLLQASAQEQEAGLAALATLAEELRREFITLGTDWHALRTTKLRDKRQDLSADARRRLEAHAVLATAYYGHDLTATQRDLLIEAAIEHLPALDPAAGAPLVTADRRVVFFLPGAVRIVLPRELPAPIARLVAEFEETKSRLKEALVESVHRTDLASGRSARKIWQALQAEQKDGLATLESTAESLRVACQKARLSGWPALLPRFPPEFAARFRHYREQGQRLREERHEKLEAVRRDLLSYQPGIDAKHFRVITTPIMIGSVNGPVGYVHQYAIVDRPSSAPDGNTALSQLRATAEQFYRDAAGRFEALASAERVLIPEAARLAGSPANRTPEELFRGFVQLTDQADMAPEYAEYRLAALQPGLSPAQRDLLLGISLEQLALSLPGGEFQPKDLYY